MGQDGTWGDHLTLIAVENMYHVSIVIVSSIEDIQPIVINPDLDSPREPYYSAT